MTNNIESAEYLRVLSDPVRQRLLEELGLTDSLNSEAFDRLARLASKLVPAPVALVSLVDSKRQFFKSHIGIDITETPLTHSFCKHVTVSGKPLIVENAPEHPLVKNNLAIPELGVVSYLGMPITISSGETLGSFCVIDSQERQWTESEIETVRELAQSVITEIELRDRIRLHEKTEIALRASENRYRSVIDSMAEGVIVQDGEGRIVAHNESAGQIFGIATEQLMGNRVEDSQWKLIREDGAEYPLHELPAIRTLMTGEPNHNQIIGVIKSNDLSWISVNTQPLIYEDNEAPQGVVSTFFDVTDTRQMLKDKERLIENLNSFARTVAHDLKNPLSQVLGYAYLLKEIYKDSSEQNTLDYVGIIETNASRMVTIIDALLLLASTRQLENVPIEPIQIDKTLRDVFERLRPNIEQKNAIITTDESFPNVLGYSPWIGEVFVNYLSNALKYGGQPPEIHIGFEMVGDQTVRMYVRDNGQGLTEQEQAQLFQPFTRLVQESGIEGHGLGLSIVRQIVERLEGEVQIASVVGEGSEFSFILPIA